MDQTTRIKELEDELRGLIECLNDHYEHDAARSIIELLRKWNPETTAQEDFQKDEDWLIKTNEPPHMVQRGILEIGKTYKVTYYLEPATNQDVVLLIPYPYCGEITNVSVTEVIDKRVHLEGMPYEVRKKPYHRFLPNANKR